MSRAVAEDLDRSGLGLRLRYLSGGMSDEARTIDRYVSRNALATTSARVCANRRLPRTDWRGPFEPAPPRSRRSAKRRR